MAKDQLVGLTSYEVVDIQDFQVVLDSLKDKMSQLELKISFFEKGVVFC